MAAKTSSRGGDLSPYAIERAVKSGSPMLSLASGGCMPDPIYIVNPCDLGPDESVWHFQFGAYGCTHLAVIDHHLEDALEIAAEWLHEHAPGVFVEPEYPEGVADMSDEQRDAAQQSAEVDLTYTESGWLASWEWHVHEADEQLAARVRSKAAQWHRREYGELPRGMVA